MLTAKPMAPTTAAVVPIATTAGVEAARATTSPVTAVTAPTVLPTFLPHSSHWVEISVGSDWPQFLANSRS